MGQEHEEAELGLTGTTGSTAPCQMEAQEHGAGKVWTVALGELDEVLSDSFPGN